MMTVSKEVYNLFTDILSKAKLNLGEEGETEFPKNDYKVYVHRTNPRLKTPPYVNVESNKELFHILVTTTGRVLQVKDYGNRPRGDKFTDIAEKVKNFMKEPSLLGGKFTELGGTIEMLTKMIWKMTEIKHC